MSVKLKLEDFSIIVNVNRALVQVLGDMTSGVQKIDSNLERVRKNLDFLEEMYEGVFRKVNKLIA